ncbi:hypothetical protein ACFL6S_09020 [Candidatus Poribacteria bacterium]
MTRLLRELLIGFLICGLTFTGFMGCSEDGTGGEAEQPPELPPNASMTVDLSTFGGEKLAPELQIPGANFSNAAIRVLLVNTAVIVGLALPTAAFKAAIDTDPIKQGDGSWLWSYEITILGVDIEANLTGRLDLAGLKTVWSMRVTSNFLLLSNFEWYTGESLLDNSSGSWLFYDSKAPGSGNELAKIEWAVSAIDKVDLIISNLELEGPNANDVLLYSIDGTTAFISFYKASDDTLVDITWDLITIAGSILAPNYNGGERASWDGDKQDIVP